MIPISEHRRHPDRRALRALRARAAVSLLTLVAALLPALAHAQPSNPITLADRHFRAGMAKHRAGDLEGALGDLREAQKLAPAPRTLFNIATLEMDLEQNLEANRDLDAYLASPDPSCKVSGATCSERAAEFLSAVRKKLGHLIVKVQPADAKVTIDGRPSPLSAWLLPDKKHVIRIEAPGQKVSKDIVIFAGGEHTESFNLSMTPEALPVKAEPPPATSSPGAAPTAKKSPVIAATAPVAETRRVAGWVLTGAGNVLLGLAGIYGLNTIDALEKYKQAGEPSSLDDEAHSSADAATGIFISGAALIAVGVYLLISGRSRPSLDTVRHSSALPAGFAW